MIDFQNSQEFKGLPYGNHSFTVYVERCVSELTKVLKNVGNQAYDFLMIFSKAFQTLPFA